MPIMSSEATWLPSTCAATPSTWPIVMTPVPPMPPTSTLNGWLRPARTGTVASGTSKGSTAVFGVLSGLRSAPPWTVTKLGQNPSVQVKSLLHDDWLIRRLRPNSVSIGSIDRQVETLPQSPHPSHTALLMNVRFAGSSHLPCLRSRRRSVAQGCS